MPPPPKVPYHPELEVVRLALGQSSPLTKEDLPRARKEIEAFTTPAPILADPTILHEEKTIPGPGGNIVLSVLRSKASVGGLRPAIYYIHGGGMVFGTRFFCIEGTFDWIKELDCVIISVEYRLAPEHPDPAPIEDCYAGLKWVSEHVSELGIDPEKIMVAGVSAGGGLSAGVALLARDRGGPKLCAQCLVYPMLDDRMITPSSQQYIDEGTWIGKTNITAWDWLLSGRRGAEDVSIYAAPSRATDLSGLPTTYIDVGSAELFRDEDVAYASRLWESGIQAELHVWEGGWHGFDMFAPDANVSKACRETRIVWMKGVFGIVGSATTTAEIPRVL